jgi:hypothetical protein
MSTTRDRPPAKGLEVAFVAAMRQARWSTAS